MFKALRNKADAMGKLTLKYVYRQLFLDNDFTDLIIKLNTQNQLYERGVNSDGEDLSVVAGVNPETGTAYSTVTVYGSKARGIKGKVEKGQRYDHVTLKDTGEFYESFRTVWSNEGDGVIIITANTIKDGEDLMDRWGRDILGLDQVSRKILIDFARVKVLDLIRYNLKKAA